MMTIELSAFVLAPIEEVFAYFDDIANTVQLNEHAVRFELVDVQPDGRRTFDIVMGAGSRQWTQTAEQVVRQPPTRLVTRGGTWVADRDGWLLTVTTDRRFTRDGAGTRIDAIIETSVDRPFHHPLRAILNHLGQEPARKEFELQLHSAVRRIEGVEEPDRPTRHERPA